MKYLITESQIDNVIFKYLDNQDFIQIYRNDRIMYFVNSESDESAQIAFYKDSGLCYVYYRLIDEISDFFSLHYIDCMNIIGRWVGNILQMKVVKTIDLNYEFGDL